MSYDPNEARDDSGRWTEESATAFLHHKRTHIGMMEAEMHKKGMAMVFPSKNIPTSSTRGPIQYEFRDQAGKSHIMGLPDIAKHLASR